MKQFILFLTCFFSLNSIYSQDCEVKKDPFSNEEVVSYDFKKKVVCYESKQGTITLEMLFVYSGDLKIIVPQGSELSFKLENGDIIQQSTIIDASPKTDITSNAVIYTNYTYKIMLTKAEIEKLAGSKVILIRYPDAKGGVMDYEIKGFGKFFSKQLLKGASCIKEHL
jgi:hypothetical protein